MFGFFNSEWISRGVILNDCGGELFVEMSCEKLNQCPGSGRDEFKSI
jgi:hypothetical protein